MRDHGRYPPISDYAFIADCHSAALISRTGSIDWCCMPRLDSSSLFARLLDWERGGCCRVAPAEGSAVHATRRYRDGSLVLETTFRGEAGEARLIDCFTMREGGGRDPHRQILRIVEGVRGQLSFEVVVAPSFDYAEIRPWIRRRRGGHFIAVGGCDGLLVSGDVPLALVDRHRLTGAFEIAAGERRRLSLVHAAPEELEDGAVNVPSAEVLDRRLEETLEWWTRWDRHAIYDGPYARQVRRSATVLKGLTNAPTGAIAAAPTTSLPESPGGSRNWDYRFSWIRDSCFTVRSLAELGHEAEADGFRRFIERSAAGSAEEIQPLFGVGGERRLPEIELAGLEGYRGAAPVRIGNRAQSQVQLDVYGELLDLAARWHDRGRSPDDDYWTFLTELVNDACRRWKDPDRGIWELRGTPRHLVFSKAMCWVALDRGIRLAESLDRDAPLARWKEVRDEIRGTVERHGYDRDRGVFVQAFDRPTMDAALLLLPVFGFVDWNDPRMVRTTEAVRDALDEDGLIRRYDPDDDDLDGTEGMFLACTFWLAECLARQGRPDEARKAFERACRTGNDLDLFAEEYDTKRGEMLGNFPQALTHLALISAAVAMADGRT